MKQLTSALSIDANTGEVSLSTDPDYETQSEYQFTVFATDAAGNQSAAQTVTVSINDLDDSCSFRYGLSLGYADHDG